MSNHAGIWIDHEKAVVVLITNTGQEIKKFTADVKGDVLHPGHSPSKHKYTPKDIMPEDRLERKAAAISKSMYDEILECVRGTDSLLVIGPGEAKGEFKKHLEAKKVRGLTVELESADKMTDPQLAAKVREHFAVIQKA